MLKKLILISISAVSMLLSGCNPTPKQSNVTVTDLRCEYLVNPLGVDVAKPRLSWIIESKQRGQKQTAFQIMVATSKSNLQNNNADLWDSGKIISNETIQITYAGKPLNSKIQCFWKVRVWDKDGKPSQWSSSAMWSMGLLFPSDWEAVWIGAPVVDINTAGKNPPTAPSPFFRKSFTADSKPQRATLYVTGLGLYQLSLNGKPVGNHILAPEYTVYSKHIQYQTYDVTDMVTTGENVIGAVLGAGWYADRLFGAPKCSERKFKGQLGLILRLDIEKPNSQVQTVVSDPSWRCTNDGPILTSSMYDGEIYDARKEMPGWDKAGFDDNGWQNVQTPDFSGANLVWQRNEPISIMTELKPISVTEPNKGIYVFDMGQNMVGWCRLKINGPEGTTVTTRHTEMLNDDGTIYTANLRTALQRNMYTKRTNGEEVFEPHFTYHGFRYVEVTGLPHKPDKDDILGCVFYSSSPQVGYFECSNNLVNKLMKNILWVQRGNMESIPTDCPQRDERAGWMGDIQAFSQTAIFNMDMAAFFSKWVIDIRDLQAADGRFPDIAPHPGDPNLGKFGVPAWGDAGTVIPWRMYQNYADKRLLEEHFQAARRWVDYIHNNNPNLIWEKGRNNDYGDWLNGNTIKLKNWPKTGASVPKQILGTAFFAHSTEIVSKMASVIGKTEEAKEYGELFEKIKDAFNKTFVKPNGTIKGQTQAGYALALRFNLLPEDFRPKAAALMVEALKPYKGHLSTGIQTTHQMMLELTRNGYHKEACRIINLRTMPSWGYTIDMDATTIWERWDGYVKGRGFQNAGMNSFNHWALGSVGEWVWRDIVGINPDDQYPAYSHFIIRPQPFESFTSAKGKYKSIHGWIISDWKLDGDKFRLDVTIPPNTTANVYILTKDPQYITENGIPARNAIGVEFLEEEKGFAVYKLDSGFYSFISRI